MSHRRRYLVVTESSRNRQLQKMILELWMLAVMSHQTRRCSCQELCKRQQTTALLTALHLLSSDGKRERVLASVILQIEAFRAGHLLQAVLCALCRYVLFRRAVGSVVNAQQSSPFARRVLPIAFRALRSSVDRLRRVEALFNTTCRKHMLATASYILLGWKRAAAWQKRSTRLITHARYQRLADGVRALCDLARSRHQAELCQSFQAAHQVRRKLFVLNRDVGWWRRCAAIRCRASLRQMTVSGRRRLELCHWALHLWEDGVRYTIYEACHDLDDRIQKAAASSQALEDQRDARESTRREDEIARLDLVNEIRWKASESADLHQKAEQTQYANSELLSQLQEERLVTESLMQELGYLKSERWCAREEPVQSLEQQLKEALDIQGSLRFSFLKTEAEAQRLADVCESTQNHVIELQNRLAESRRAYAAAIENMDRKVRNLRHEGQEAEHKAGRLEKALDSVTFRARMCDLENERWK